MLCLIPFQAVSALEACLRFGERYQLASRISATMMGLYVAGGCSVWAWQHGDIVEQVAMAAKFQRAGAVAFLLGVIIFYATVQWRGLIARQDGAHLILSLLWAITWAIPIVRPLPPSWPSYFSDTWMITARSWLLAAWTLLVLLRRKRVFQFAHSPR